MVQVLDDLKKEKIEARDAIRWLESQFHKGNRFFRAQRPNERASIPFVKYPKKKDKEMHVFIQIVECCHYFADQQKGASNVVTFLLGSNQPVTNGENKDFSYAGLAKSVGIVLEPITSFYGKWKKSKGNRWRRQWNDDPDPDDFTTQVTRKLIAEDAQLSKAAEPTVRL